VECLVYLCVCAEVTQQCCWFWFYGAFGRPAQVIILTVVYQPLLRLLIWARALKSTQNPTNWIFTALYNSVCVLGLTSLISKFEVLQYCVILPDGESVS